MKCKLCIEKAIHYMPQHRLALCSDHFIDWIPTQTERFIKKYHMINKNDIVLVAVSGGKDSLSLWDVLLQLGIPAHGVYINLGIDEDIAYSDRSQEAVENFAKDRNLILHIVDIKTQFGKTLYEINYHARRGKKAPCAGCGIIKRHVLNQVTVEKGYSVLATGHNLDDEASILFANTLHWDSHLLTRQYPVLSERRGLPRKVKPFCRIYERDIAAYAAIRGIRYIQDECPYSKNSKTNYYKSILNMMEHKHPATKMEFYVSFLEAQKAKLFSSGFLRGDDENYRLCPTCHQPTTNQGLCSFCHLLISS